MIEARLWRDRKGGVGLVAAAMMPVLVGFAAFAVDLGAVQLDTRRLQGLADAAALAAASGSTGTLDRAQAVVRGSGWPRAVTVRVVEGTYLSNSTVDPAARFVATATRPDAARVELESRSPTFFARVFGTADVTITRHATARRQRFAAFAIGSRLASLNGGILNAYLGALTGSEVNLSVMDYNALAGAEIDLLEFLPAVRTTAGLSAVTFNDVLASQVAMPQLLGALATTLAGRGQSGAAAAIRAIAAVSGGQSIALAALIDAGGLGLQSTSGTGVARVDALSLVTAMLQAAGPRRQVAVDLGASIPGLAKTSLVVAVGERMQQSPWVTITDNGMPIVRTAQARIYLRTQLLPLALPGLGPLAKIDLPILVEVASAEGRLASIDCATGASRGVGLDGRVNAVSAAIGTVDEGRLGDFSSPLAPSRAKLVDGGFGLVTVSGSSQVSLGAVEQWQRLRFSEPEIASGTRKTIASSTPVGGIASSLVNTVSLSAQLLGLNVPLDPLLRGAVGSALTLVAPALDTLLATVTGTLGVGLGEADLRVTGMRCGQAVLVA